MHRLVRGAGREPYWEPAACINFGKGVLEWLLASLAANPAAAHYVMRYEPRQSAILLLQRDGGGGGGGGDGGGRQGGGGGARRGG
mmetsp:Transcript_18442/g.54290  ORF Transcript_18442/g.54290 Transcript_18442/m.54290 type:complete len:85 (+) Transcript_18442:974-1228(+)